MADDPEIFSVSEIADIRARLKRDNDAAMKIREQRGGRVNPRIAEAVPPPRRHRGTTSMTEMMYLSGTTLRATADGNVAANVLGGGTVDALRFAPDGSILARMNDRWHIVSGVEGRD